ncbi:uncharacterized [Tachysurus ichikawai]
MSYAQQNLLRKLSPKIVKVGYVPIVSTLSTVAEINLGRYGHFEKFRDENTSFSRPRLEIDVERMHIYETWLGQGLRRKSIHARILSFQSWQNKSLQQAQMAKW